LDITEKYHNYTYKIIDNYELVYIDKIFVRGKKDNFEVLTQFKFSRLERQKKIIKDLIKAEFNNIPIRIYELYKY
jgi:hypothetical protein